MATETPGPEDPWILVWFPADGDEVKFAGRGFEDTPSVLGALRKVVALGARQDPDEEHAE